MRRILSLSVFIILFGCHRHHVEPNCTVNATVVDLSATGGCGFGFVLDNGTVLIPDQHPSNCGHHQNPLANFALSDSLKVKIGFEDEHHGNSSCSAGKEVEITCIQVLNAEKVE